LCFPQLSKEQQQKMVVEHFRSYGRGLVDMGLGMMGTRARAEKFTELVGAENLTGLLGSRKIILVNYHTTTLDKGWLGFLPDLDAVSMMKRDKNPVINWFLFNKRSRFKKAQLLLREEGLGGIISGMQAGKLCYLIPDEDFGDGRSAVFARFFGQPRSTLNIVSRLARITDAVVIPGICRLIPETGRYRTTFCAPLENYPTGDHVADAEQLHRAMEKLILEAPEQYLWTFRWFRTQPGNTPDPYELPARQSQ
jgi:lauroyl/myristoyl acyltransferase